MDKNRESPDVSIARRNVFLLKMFTNSVKVEHGRVTIVCIVRMHLELTL